MCNLECTLDNVLGTFFMPFWYLFQNFGKLWILLQNMSSNAKLYSLPLSSTSKRGNFHLNVSARRNRSSRGEAIVSRGQKKRASTTATSAVLPFFNTIPRLLLRLKANFVGRAHFVLLSSFSLESRAQNDPIMKGAKILCCNFWLCLVSDDD